MDQRAGWPVVVALAVLAAACATSPSNKGAGPTTGFVFSSLELGSWSYPYALYVPRSYDDRRAWPLILFLHGKGECGRDGSASSAWGSARSCWHGPSAGRSWCSFPEGRQGRRMGTARGCGAGNARRGRRPVQRRPEPGAADWPVAGRPRHLGPRRAPPRAVGGAGAGLRLRRRADGFPPVRSLASRFEGTAADLAPALAGLPIWAFHGEADDTVPVAATIELVAAPSAPAARRS